MLPDAVSVDGSFQDALQTTLVARTGAVADRQLGRGLTWWFAAVSRW